MRRIYAEHPINNVGYSTWQTRCIFTANEKSRNYKVLNKINYVPWQSAGANRVTIANARNIAELFRQPAFLMLQNLSKSANSSA